MKRSFVHICRWLAVVLSGFSFTALGQSGDADLAQELTNPLADLVTVPIQMNFDRRLGPADDGTKITTNVQPVIPFKGPGNWNLISRTIVPVIHQDEIVPGAGPAAVGLVMRGPWTAGLRGRIHGCGPERGSVPIAGKHRAAQVRSMRSRPDDMTEGGDEA